MSTGRLAKLHTKFAELLSPFGAVVIAGGAVRDSLMGKAPKDWDIFVLQGGQFDFERAKQDIKPLLEEFSEVPPAISWHKSEPYLVAGIEWEGYEIQILVNPAATVDELLDTFDWNVCRFAFDGSVTALESLDNIQEGKELGLHRVTFPLSTLRRGFRFSERMKMKLPRQTIVSLCRLIVQNADAGNDMGPTGNEPDEPSLEANTLTE